jgi:hypothetical protein
MPPAPSSDTISYAPIRAPRARDMTPWIIAVGTVRRSGFGVRRSGFGVRGSGFGVRGFLFGARRAWLIVPPNVARRTTNLERRKFA